MPCKLSVLHHVLMRNDPLDGRSTDIPQAEKISSCRRTTERPRSTCRARDRVYLWASTPACSAISMPCESPLCFCFFCSTFRIFSQHVIACQDRSFFSLTDHFGLGQPRSLSAVHTLSRFFSFLHSFVDAGTLARDTHSTTKRVYQHFL